MADRKVEVQTDKKQTKTVPCTYPGCNTDIIVNMFYAPAKARCSEHKGITTPGMRAAAIVTPQADEPVVPNHALADLRCPFDGAGMEIIGIEQEMGWITFECRKCLCGVKVQPKWGPLYIKEVPDAWKEFVEHYNLFVRESNKVGAA